MSTQEHKNVAPKTVNCKVITVSDTRTQQTDKSGRLMIELLEQAGHRVVDYVIVIDEAEPIQNEILKGCGQDSIDVILTNGGTGIAKRDVTIESVQSLLEKEIVGFGEIFRMLSYQEDIGSAAILSRAIAGVVKNKAVFSTPGSSGAVKLAMNKLILPEIGHVVREIKKDL
ncbi:MogA/MoaB family molybdenum cofactor biosynthesis protein [Neobacillus vireti]|uniref:Molybdenum cofactor biosynthesis protein B n=1 Tax=Neobacillus vireti LMG 21834 TaxID=1131730 RepID=A0AB94INF5_9BACI|nr:molybdenum cofactor biosynthesis protein B [Neobacillus vireti]ETI68564.1 molybdenum cofactor synthesis domain-containing protein [Neobacillus vireti LMG 21834]KLT16210.1 molybdenum cofactor biosynthesis protein B [Neobacillus vireti]